MKKNTEEIYMALCLQQVETRLNWGKSGEWTNQDFENLSERIRETTDVKLSITTLKRIWGRVKYESAPTITTLNALASFLGYESWRAFKQAHAEEEAPVPEARTINESPVSKKRSYLWPIITLVALIIIGITGFNVIRQKKASMASATYAFSSRTTVTEGIPNTVIFDYDARQAPEDSVFIQQNWDPSRRVQVSRNERQATSIYYYPGHFQAKLIVSGKIVKEHNLLIKTNGWLPMIEQKPVPVYFKASEAISGDELGLSVQQILDKNVPMQPKAPWVRYSNIGGWDSTITTARFHFEAELRNNYAEGSAACQQAMVSLLYEGGAIMIPLANKGCEAELNLSLGDRLYAGKTNDLSGLGTNMGNWTKLSCESKDGRINIQVNDKIVFDDKAPADTFKIIGMNVRFQGTGSVRHVKLN